MRIGVVVVATIVSVFALAGCSGEAGTAEPTNGSAENGEQSPPVAGQPTSELPHSGAPAVQNPIDTTRWEADPCATLTDAQLAGAGLTIRDVKAMVDAGEGPTCDWRIEPRRSGGFSVAFITPTTEGLSALYRRNAGGGYAYWEVLDPIGGYPAVINSSSEPESERSRGRCGIAVGVRDDRIFSVQMDDRRDGADDPCGTAVQVAELVIETMTGGD